MTRIENLASCICFAASPKLADPATLPAKLCLWAGLAQVLARQHTSLGAMTGTASNGVAMCVAEDVERGARSDSGKVAAAAGLAAAPASCLSNGNVANEQNLGSDRTLGSEREMPRNGEAPGRLKSLLQQKLKHKHRYKLYIRELSPCNVAVTLDASGQHTILWDCELAPSAEWDAAMHGERPDTPLPKGSCNLYVRCALRCALACVYVSRARGLAASATLRISAFSALP